VEDRLEKGNVVEDESVRGELGEEWGGEGLKKVLGGMGLRRGGGGERGARMGRD